METFADYILSEKDYIKKLEIVYYLKKELTFSLIILLFLRQS